MNDLIKNNDSNSNEPNEDIETFDPRYANVIGSLDLIKSDTYMVAKIDDWDYPGEAVLVLLAGKVWLTLSLEQAKNLQTELNKILI